MQAAPFGHHFQFADREGEQVFFRAGQHQAAIGVDQRRLAHRLRHQQGFARFQFHHFLARLHAADQIAQFGDEAVAAAAGQQVVFLRLPGQHGEYRRARLQFQERGQRHAVAAPAGNFGRIDGVAAAERVEHHHRVDSARFQRLLQFVAFFKRGGRQIQPVPGPAANPALARQDERYRLVGRGVGERGAFGFGHQCAARVAKLLGIGLHLFDDEFFLRAFVGQ